MRCSVRTRNTARGRDPPQPVRTVSVVEGRRTGSPSTTGTTRSAAEPPWVSQTATTASPASLCRRAAGAFSTVSSIWTECMRGGCPQAHGDPSPGGLGPGEGVGVRSVDDEEGVGVVLEVRGVDVDEEIGRASCGESVGQYV